VNTWIGFVRSDATNWKRISDGRPAANVWGSYSFPTFNSGEPYMIFNAWDVECDCSGDNNASICEAI
jgi:hypothetical protein